MTDACDILEIALQEDHFCKLAFYILLKMLLKTGLCSILLAYKEVPLTNRMSSENLDVIMSKHIVLKQLLVDSAKKEILGLMAWVPIFENRPIPLAQNGGSGLLKLCPQCQRKF